MSLAIAEQQKLLTKYKFDNQLDSMQMGKNPTTTMLWSLSKKNNQKKLWVGKNISINYSLINATCDVFFGQLAMRLFSKSQAPKTKFNPTEQGIVSRVIDDGNVDFMNFSRFLACKDAYISNDAVQSLAQALCFKLIIGDRDIALRNMVVQYSPLKDNPTGKRAKKIYGIDHEYGLVAPSKTALALEALLPKLAEDPKVLADILVRDSNHWNFRKYDSNSTTSNSYSVTPETNSFDNKKKEDMEAYEEKLTAWLSRGLDADTVIACLKDTANKIAADDFKILKDIKEEIANQVIDADPVYSEAEISKKIMPTVDFLIEKLQEQIQVIQDFDAPKVENSCKLAVK